MIAAINAILLWVVDLRKSRSWRTIRIAARSARRSGLPDAELGFSPTGGLTYLLNHIVGAGWAMHLAMTGQILSADESQRIGLVTEVVDDDALENKALSLSQRLAACPPTGMKNIKRSFNMALESKPVRHAHARSGIRCGLLSFAGDAGKQALRAFMLRARKKN